MKYLTKEELMDITDELLKNPTRETLKMLSYKYSEAKQDANAFMPSQNTANEVNTTTVSSAIPVEVNNNLVEQNQMESSVVMPVVGTQNVELAPGEQVNTLPPVFEVPKLETPTFVNQNSESINFNGNIFDTQVSNVGNLMQTTDNFNTMSNTMPTTEVPIAPAPFFSAPQELANNPIPVGGPVNNMTNPSPSMFGQFEQNYS